MVPIAEQETLVPLSAEELEQKQEEEDVKEEEETVKSELESVPGSVLTSKVVIIPPRMEKRFHAAVTGLPRYWYSAVRPLLFLLILLKVTGTYPLFSERLLDEFYQ